MKDNVCVPERVHNNKQNWSSWDFIELVGGKNTNAELTQARLNVRLKLLPREAGAFHGRIEVFNEHLHSPESSECRP